MVHALPVYGTLEDALKAASGLCQPPSKVWLSDIQQALEHVTQFVTLTDVKLEDFHLTADYRL